MKTKIAILSFSFLLFISCSNDEINNVEIPNETTSKVQLTQEEAISISFDEVKEIGEEGIRDIIADFINAQNTTETKSAENKALSITLNEKYYVSDENGNNQQLTKSSATTMQIPVYEAIIDSNGKKSFTLVAADERTPKVYAYLPDFDPSKINDTNLQVMLGLSKQSIIDDIYEIEEIKSNLRDKTIAKIVSELGIEQSEFGYDRVSKYIAVDGIEEQVVTKVNGNMYQYAEIPTQILGGVYPLSQVSWDQSVPYNRNYPTGPVLTAWGTIMTDKLPVGCAVTAIAQTLSVIEPTYSFGGQYMSWPYLKQTEELIERGQQNASPEDKLNMAGKLFRSIYDDTQSYPVWNPNRTAIVNVATDFSKIASYMTSKTLCNSPRTFNGDICKLSLDAYRPVLVYGTLYYTLQNGSRTSDGHAFLFDGYLVAKKLSKVIVQNYDMYWHANLGWGPSLKGYFKLRLDAHSYMTVLNNNGDRVEITTTDYTMISDIRRR